MAEEIRFVSGQMPSLLYATKQIVAASAITRAIHRHERFTEMLYVYQGAGQYIAGGYSYPIRTGDILLYNQGDLHEVTSSLQHEIGTLCFGISGLQLCGLPEGHFTKAENGFVRPAMDEIDHMQSRWCCCRPICRRMRAPPISRIIWCWRTVSGSTSARISPSS